VYSGCLIATKNKKHFKTIIMNNTIYPSLWYDGNAKEAAAFYCSIFKNSKITTDTPMVVTFELNGKRFMGLNGGSMFTINPSISFFVKCESINEVNKVWNKLVEGGKILMAIDKYPWSERYGWVQDKFGVTWQVMLNTIADAKFSITPAMLFTGNQFGKAESAIKFYSSVFDNSVTGTLSHYPEGNQNAGKIMYAEFQLNNYEVIAMDGPGGHQFSFNEAISFVVDCNTQDEIDFYWNKLTADGGKESQCGWLKDKFGVSWQIVPTVLGKLMTDAEKAPRVMQAFMQMKKFNIEALLNA
jgi:predicted 3-demethylubiquinone-9 3-methyltransferase (glyoxalase superfamily)